MCSMCPKENSVRNAEGHHKYVVLKGKEKEKEISGCVMLNNMTIKNVLFPVSLCVCTFEDGSDFLKMKLILTNVL